MPGRGVHPQLWSTRHLLPCRGRCFLAALQVCDVVFPGAPITLRLCAEPGSQGEARECSLPVRLGLCARPEHTRPPHLLGSRELLPATSR